jgi:hypothetical protein
MTRSVFDSAGLYCGFLSSDTVQYGSVGSYQFRRCWRVAPFGTKGGLEGQFSDTEAGLAEAQEFCRRRAKEIKKEMAPRPKPKQLTFL